MRICARFGAHLIVGCPPGYEPNADVARAAQDDAAASGGSLEIVTDPRAAAAGANVLYTDVWVSMGQDAEQERRLRDFQPYRLDAAMLALAAPDAVAMHDLPAHVGDEITAEVLYGPRSLVWDQAENRLHTQKAVMALVIR
jgi:ornithine carbamoyltransferase